MKPVVDRPPSYGWHRTRATVAPAPSSVNGVLHDLGHELAALSYLAEAVCGDPGLSPDTRRRSEMLCLQTAALLDILRSAIMPPESGGVVELRQLLRQVISLAALETSTTVVLSPGPEVLVAVNGPVMRRVLGNLIDNAVRAAGPGGRVDITIVPADRPVVEIADNGPGVGHGVAGWASLGLRIVAQLVTSFGGRFDIYSRSTGGTIARVEVPAPSIPESYS
jgi:signal transduction histidine kinase